MYKPKENKELLCETVGELKKALLQFDDKTPLSCDGVGDYISVSLWYDDDPPHKTTPNILIRGGAW